MLTVFNRVGKRPRVEVEEDSDFLYALRLSKAGYGSVREIEGWDARRVLQALAYESYLDDYEQAWIDINR